MIRKRANPMNEDFKLTCPCCNAKILVDHKTGAVLTHEESTSSRSKTFEQAVEANKRRKSDAEDLFAQAVREHENQEELLEKKFREAFDKIDKDGTRPQHPLDTD